MALGLMKTYEAVPAPRIVIAVGACAITGGLPAQRNHMDVGVMLTEVYHTRPGLSATSRIPDDPELPLPLNKVHPIHEVVHVDYFLPGCPPPADVIFGALVSLLDGATPDLSATRFGR